MTTFCNLYKCVHNDGAACQTSPNLKVSQRDGKHTAKLVCTSLIIKIPTRTITAKDLKKPIARLSSYANIVASLPPNYPGVSYRRLKGLNLARDLIYNIGVHVMEEAQRCEVGEACLAMLCSYTKDDGYRSEWNRLLQLAAIEDERKTS